MSNTSQPLNLADLSPQEATLELSTCPGKPLTLCRWSLRIRTWAQTKYGSEGLKNIFEKHQIVEIADMVYFMVKDKTAYPTLDSFLDAVVTTQDQINMIMAMLKTIGMGEPEIKQVADSMKIKEAPPSPNQKTPTLKKKRIGAKSSTR